MEKVWLFAYGTLREGNKAHGRLIKPYFRKELGLTPGKLKWLRRGYPVLAEPEAPDEWVGGTLFYVGMTSERWAKLDAWEEIRSLTVGPYVRELRWIQNEAGWWRKAWVYGLNPLFRGRLLEG